MSARRKITPKVRRYWLGPIDNRAATDPLSAYLTECLGAALTQPLQLFRGGWAHDAHGPFFWPHSVRALWRRGLLARVEGDDAIVAEGRGMRLYATREGRQALARYTAALNALDAELAQVRFL